MLPGSVEWEVLGEACRELDKLATLVADKQRRAAGDKKAEAAARLESVRAALADDRAERAVRFQIQAEQVAAAAAAGQPPGSPRLGSPRAAAAAERRAASGSE